MSKDEDELEDGEMQELSQAINNNATNVAEIPTNQKENTNLNENMVVDTTDFEAEFDIELYDEDDLVYLRS
jgi:hypothetical protein